MYITIILVLALTFAVTIGFVFFKVQALNKRLAALNITVKHLGSQPRVNTEAVASSTEVHSSSATFGVRPSLQVPWPVVSSFGLIFGFMALFGYSKHYGVDFWYFVESPFSAVTSVIVLFLVFLMFFSIFYINALVLLTVQDSIGILEAQKVRKQLSRIMNFVPYASIVTIGLALSIIYYFSQDDERWFFNTGWLALALSLTTAFIFFCYAAYKPSRKGTTLRFSLENAFLVLISSVVKFFAFVFLVPVVFDFISKLSVTERSETILIFLIPQVIGAGVVLVLSAWELKTLKPMSSNSVRDEIGWELVRPIRTVQFYLLLFTVFTIFIADVLTLKYFAERSLITTGFATERMDSEVFRQNVWTEERLGSALQQLSYEEKRLYESEQWRIYFKGTNQTLVRMRKGDVIETFELPTSSPLLRFYRRKVILNKSDRSTESESGS